MKTARSGRRESHSRIRDGVAREAARLISTGEAGNYPQARRKASERLGVMDRTLLPANEDIAQALQDYQRLFRPDTAALSRRYREAALEAMEFLAPFQPRLTGPVLEGTADAQSVVTLHLHDDDADAVAHHLQQHDIPADADRVRLRLDAHREDTFPVWRFFAGDVAFELVGLPSLQVRQAPWARGDDQPMRRASAAQLRRLLQDPDVAPDTAAGSSPHA
ncbi:hypothetical protein INQ40_03140 [Lysobacter sp. H21R4]|uniref:hypothetical protein n=1 Tax=Lysobacter sp. H21R4 TaxID=2781021 RepID=UPI00188984C3|nr:hypothetical protein [Lysobacter sp. H21R4]QOY63944.1 hypothetical protein INQ40_03140 [Lysobacter sp. H21R4]